MADERGIPGGSTETSSRIGSEDVERAAARDAGIIVQTDDGGVVTGVASG